MICLRKYLFRIIIVLSVIFVLAYFATFLFINKKFFPPSLKTEIEQYFSQNLPGKISIARITYSPFNRVILSQARFYDSGGGGSAPTLIIDKLKISFSLLRFLSAGELIVTDIKIEGAGADIFLCAAFLKENMGPLLAFLAKLTPPDDLAVNLEKINLSFSLPDGRVLNASVLTRLRIRQRDVLVKGSLKIPNIFSAGSKAGHILKFKFKGALESNGVRIDDLEFKADKLFSRFWGFYENSTLQLNGFFELNDFLKRFSENKTGSNFPAGLFRRLGWRADKLALPQRQFNTDLEISDISWRMKFLAASLKIQSLDFFLNNVPIHIAGDVFFVPAVSMDLKFSSYQDQLKQARIRNYNAFDAAISGTLKDWGFYGKIASEFRRKGANKPSAEKAEIIFDNLNFKPLDKKVLEINFNGADLSYWAQDNFYNVFLDNFSSELDYGHEIKKPLIFDSGIYGGILSGRGQIDTSGLPLKLRFDFRVKDAEANKLALVLEHFSKVHGKISSRLSYDNYDGSILKGGMIMRDGYLENFEFFKWLADFFAMPGLSRIEFGRLSGAFLVDDESAGMDIIDLDSSQISLDGYFRQLENGLVESRLSLGLSRPILEGSPKFRPLLSILGNDIESLVFDFQLSGLLSAMNFKWLESDFKQRLKARIPDFIERAIERNVEQAIFDIAH